MLPLLPARTFLSHSWQRYTQHFGRFLEVSLWLLVPGLVQLAFFFLLTLPSVQIELKTVWNTGMLIGQAFSILLTIWVGIRLIKLSLAHDPKEEGYIATHPRVGWELFFPALWVHALVGLALLGGGIVVLPAIWLFISLSFSAFVLVDQDKRGLQALNASYLLVRNRWWPVLWRFLIATVTVLVLSFLLLTILTLAINALFGSTLGTDVERLTRGLVIDNIISVQALRGYAVSQLRDSLLTALTMPFMFCAQAVLYKSLKDSYVPAETT